MMPTVGEKAPPLFLALNNIRTTIVQWTWTGPCLHTRLKKKKGTEELRKGRIDKKREGNKLYRDRIAEGLRQKDETAKTFHYEEVGWNASCLCSV